MGASLNINFLQQPTWRKYEDVTFHFEDHHGDYRGSKTDWKLAQPDVFTIMADNESGRPVST